MPDQLNPAQRAAVETVDGPVIIAAGPGTGKTRTFAHRVAHLIQDRHVSPERILAVTFTRSAGGEMKARLQRLLGAALDRPWVETYHASALRILRDQGYPFGPGVEFSLIPDADKPALLDGLVPKKEATEFLADLRREKQRLAWSPDARAVEYQKRLAARRLLDFDDLFLHSTRLFRERPEVAAAYRKRFEYLVVDEFQDTSFAQYQFLLSLAPENLCVIGDPDQAIYGFAGGFRAFDAFRTDFPLHRVCPLSENYRSQGVIVQAATQVIAKSPAQLPRQLTAHLANGLPLVISRHGTDRQEAEMIVRKIETLLGGSSYFTIDSGWAQTDDEPRTYGLSDIVILYRLHALSRPIEEALERAGLPYRCFGKPNAAQDLEDFVRGEPEPRTESIRLMTLHRAKGLEFPVVFIAGCEDGLLPYDRNGDAEEERRLFFVGMTRAQQRLFLSSSAKRFLYGETRRANPSTFLADIQNELRRLEETQAPRRPLEQERQQTLF
jgi:DNA helicase-2/ATP-dependent DNA helicase PcrA